MKPLPKLVKPAVRGSRTQREIDKAVREVKGDTPVTAPVAARFNSGKMKYHLVPREIYDMTAAVLNKGAEKYAPNNWKKGGPVEVPANSLERHFLAWKSGEDIDPDDGLPHMAKIVTNALFIEYYRIHGLVTEDFRTATE